MEVATDEYTKNVTNETRDDEKVTVWKCDCNLKFLKSLFGIFNIGLVILSLLSLILLSAAKKVNCHAAYVTTYEFYNFSFGACLLIYLFRFVVYVFSCETGCCCLFPCLIWNCCVSFFFAFCFFFSSVAVLSVSCGVLEGYRIAGAMGLVSWAVMVAELVYNIILLRREHTPTENKLLLFIGVKRKSHRNDPA